MSKIFYVTTPIYYPNGIPHVGTAYTTIAADILARWHKFRQGRSFFLTGTDEHGQKVEKAAKSRNLPIQEHVNEMVQNFKKAWEKLNIQYDDFIRTTENRHTQIAVKIFKTLLDKGEIYKGEYEGWYCVSCETFWIESQVVEKKCPNSECGRVVEWVEEAVRKSVSATVGEAVKLKIVDLEADNLKDLLGKINGRKVKVLNHTIILKTKNALVKKAPMTSVERFLMTITNPEVVLILFMLGSYGLLFELLSPGGVLPGVVGAICLILAFYAMGTLSVNYAGVFLIVLSFVLFLLDLKLQAHGTLTIGGIVSLIMGSLLLFESNITYTAGYLSAVAASVFLTLVFFLVAVKKVWEAARLKPNTGREGIVGKIGVVKTALNPQGYIALDGTYWKAVVDNGPVNEGEKVSVVKVENLILYVKKVEAN